MTLYYYADTIYYDTNLCVYMSRVHTSITKWAIPDNNAVEEQLVRFLSNSYIYP